MLDLSRWSEEELMVFEEYDFLCLLCGFSYADTLHHEPPRSQNPNWESEPWTQFPLCNTHHEALTTMNRQAALNLLLEHENDLFPGAIERIKSAYAVQHE